MGGEKSKDMDYEGLKKKLAVDYKFEDGETMLGIFLTKKEIADILALIDRCASAPEISKAQICKRITDQIKPMFGFKITSDIMDEIANEASIGIIHDLAHLNTLTARVKELEDEGKLNEDFVSAIMACDQRIATKSGLYELWRIDTGSSDLTYPDRFGVAKWAADKIKSLTA